MTYTTTDLMGRVARVTGSGTGIGRAVAHALAGAGCRVVVNARTGSNVEQVAQEITDAGGNALGVRADVSDPDSVEAMFRQARRAFGPVEILVACAGISGPRAFGQDVTPGEFLEVLKVNLWGTLLCCKYALPPMIQRRAGRIITFTGAGAREPLKGALPYASSKAGIEGLTRNLALEVGPMGVTCNCIGPGLVDTPGFPLSGYPPERRMSMRPVGPEHAARLAVWLASDAASDVNGQSIDAPEWDSGR